MDLGGWRFFFIISWSLGSVALFAPDLAFAQSSSFTYEGRLFTAAGSPLLDTVSVKFQILSPSGNCVLYEEVQSGVDLSSTKGSFSLSVGSDPGAGKRSAAFRGAYNPSMVSVFRNGATLSGIPVADCAAGSYTAGASDTRLLRVQVTQGSTTETLSPDLVINTVPSAQVAQSLQGFLPSDFLRLDVANGINGHLGLTAVGAGAGQTREFRFYELAANGAEYSAFKAPDSQSTSLTYVLPSSQPAAGDILKASAPSSGVVTLSWGPDAGAGGGISNFNGSSQSSQSFTAIDIAAAVTAPTWSTNTGAGTHTLQIPMASGTGVTGGLITKAEHTAFSAKVDRAGDTMTGDLSFGGTRKITNLVDPTAAQEGATKAYVDSVNSGKIGGTLTAGRVPFATGAATLSDDAGLNWDNTNKRLGIGTASPTNVLSVFGDGTNTTASPLRVYNTSSFGTSITVENSTNSWSLGAGGGGAATGPTSFAISRTSNFPNIAISLGGDVGIGGSLLNSSFSGATLIARSSGNVGIGTTAPLDTLSIGTAPVASATRAQVNLSNTALSGGSASGTYLGANPAAFAGDFINFQVNGGTSKFKVTNQGAVIGDWLILQSSNTLTLKGQSTVIQDNVGNDRLVVDASGRIGIGTTSPGALLQLGTAGTSLGTFRLTGNTSGYVQLQPAAAAGSWTMTLPPDAGTNGYVLQTNGSGVTSWVAQSGGGASSGTAGHIQFSNGASGFSSDSNQLFWDATNNRLGVGTNTPSKELSVYGPNPTIALTNTTFTDLRLFTDSSGATLDAGGGNLIFNTGNSLGVPNTERMRITQAGNIGIGTSNPSYNLHIGEPGSAWIGTFPTPNLFIKKNGDVGIAIQNATDGVELDLTTFGNEAWVGTQNAKKLNLVTDNTARLTIGTTGNVGIGTPSPSFALAVSKSEAGSDIMSLTNTSATGYSSLVMNDNAGTTRAFMGWANGSATTAPNTLQIGTLGAHNFEIYTGSTPRMTIGSGGNVGIGTTSPTARLGISRSAAGPGAALQVSFDDGGAAGNRIGIATNYSDGSSEPYSALKNTMSSSYGGAVRIGVENTWDASDGGIIYGLKNSADPGDYVLSDTNGIFYGVYNSFGSNQVYGNNSVLYGLFNDLSTANDVGNSEVVYGTYSKGTTYSNGTDVFYGNYVTGSVSSTGGTQYGIYVDLTQGTATKYPAIFQGGNVGIGTTTPQATLDVAGKIAVSASGTPALSSCGTGASISGNDTRGRITFGTGGVTSCTVTFASAFASAPICVVSPTNSASLARPSTITASVLTLTTAADASGNSYNYICLQ